MAKCSYFISTRGTWATSESFQKALPYCNFRLDPKWTSSHVVIACCSALVHSVRLLRRLLQSRPGHRPEVRLPREHARGARGGILDRRLPGGPGLHLHLPRVEKVPHRRGGEDEALLNSVTRVHLVNKTSIKSPAAPTTRPTPAPSLPTNTSLSSARATASGPCCTCLSFSTSAIL